MEFMGDQGRDVYIIRDLFKNGNLFFIGPQTSIGNMYLGPWFYYLIAPALLVANYNPVGPAIFIALINIATIYLIYFVAKKWFSNSVGLIAAFLFAISPVVIKYSNFIWNPNIMPFFALLFIYFFFEAIFRQKYQKFIYASLAFVMVINSHYLGLAILPLPGIYWLVELFKLIKSKSKKLTPFLLNTFFAFLVFILSLTPQILFDLKHNGQNIKALLSFFTYRETTVNIKPYKAIPELPSIFNQVATDLLSARNVSVGITVSIVFTILLVIFFVSSFRKRKISTQFLAIFGWYFFGLIALALYKQHIYAHYFAFLFPACFILIALLINKYKYIGFPLMLIIIYFSLTNNPLRYSPNNQMVHSKNIATSINSHISQNDGAFNIAMLASYNDFRAQAPRYFVNQNNLLSQELYREAKTLFVIIDDQTKWPKGVESDIWEINVFKENSNYKLTDNFESIDGTKIIKLSK